MEVYKLIGITKRKIMQEIAEGEVFQGQVPPIL